MRKVFASICDDHTIECNHHRTDLKEGMKSALAKKDDIGSRRTMQRPHPSQPNSVSVSLRNMEDRMAQTTTERAPRGVTTMASTKA